MAQRPTSQTFHRLLKTDGTDAATKGTTAEVRMIWRQSMVVLKRGERCDPKRTNEPKTGVVVVATKRTAAANKNEGEAV